MAHVIPTRRHGLSIVLVLVVLAAVGAALWWAGQRDDHAGPSPTGMPAAPTQAPAPGSPAFDAARTQLAQLRVKGWDREQNFERFRFGERWSDDVNVEFGHNGCNTRDDILRRDLADLAVRPGTCYAQSGTLHDPYTGVTIPFVRGPDTSDAVEIDHVVSLADAWYKGARLWDDGRRRDFANDPSNLLAVSPKANFDKAFRDAASWLPPNEAFRCAFIARQIEVKTAYGLWVSEKEKDAMASVLARC